MSELEVGQVWFPIRHPDLFPRLIVKTSSFVMSYRELAGGVIIDSKEHIVAYSTFRRWIRRWKAQRKLG